MPCLNPKETGFNVKQYMSNYSDFVARKRAQYGDQFDDSDLDPRFIRFFDSGERIEVGLNGFTMDGTKRGRVGVSTGWKPVFLLMLKSNSVGSSITLGPKDEIIRVVSK